MTIRYFLSGLAQRFRPASRPAWRPRTRPLTLEALDDRRLPAVVVSQPVNGLVTVTGDHLDNTIELRESKGFIHVVGDGVDHPRDTSKVFFIDVLAKGGSDLVTVESTLPLSIAWLKVNGGDGVNDQLKAVEPGFTRLAHNYTVTQTTITRDYTPAIDYSQFDDLTLDTPSGNSQHLDNRIDIESLDTNLTVNAGEGNDTINFSPAARRLSNILVPDTVTIHGGNGTDTVHLFDQNGGNNLPVGHTYTIGATNVNRSTFSGVTFDGGLEGLGVHSGDDNSICRVRDGASVPLRIEDAGGTDVLDYTAWRAGVTVDLTAGTATGLTGGISGIENALGGAGPDRMTGDAGGNYFAGNADVDVLRGGGGRDVLIGGLGADELAGGTGDDILIDGTTIYDTDQLIDRGVGALSTILAEWQNPNLSYSQRIAAIRSGAGGYKLDGTTVSTDAFVDKLSGEGGRDWFWAVGPLQVVPPGGNPRDKLPDVVLFNLNPGFISGLVEQIN
jgi:hypothetical protein